MKRPMRVWLLVPLIAGMLLTAVACNGNITTQELQGLLQAVQGQEMLVKLDDGTVVKIEVEAAKADDAQKLVGREVKVSTTVDDNGVHKLAEVERRGQEVEDQQLSGAIGSLAESTVVIDGKTFKVTANTVMDSGLKPGVKVKVEFITLADGTYVATEIEAKENEFRFSGKVDSLAEDKVVIGGKTFKLNASSEIDDTLRSGSTVQVKFQKLDDNSLLATHVEIDNSGVDLNMMRFSGKVEAKDDKSMVVNGQTFKVDAATKVDDSVISGKLARVEFESQDDGSLLAKRVFPDDGAATEDATTGGAISEIGKTTVVIGGKTFKIGPATTLDTGLAAGVNAKVEFITLSDGSLLATDIETMVDDTKVTGALSVMSKYSFVIGGKTFIVNAATRLDGGLMAGADVRVEFITLADGTLLATEIETAPREAEVRGQEAEAGRGGAGELEPGDDKGGTGGAQPVDDKGGTSGTSGTSGGTSGTSTP